MEGAELDRLRILAETAAILEDSPASEAALRRRDEWVRRAAENCPLQVVATTARLSLSELDEVLEPSADRSSQRDERLPRLARRWSARHGDASLRNTDPHGT